MAGPHVIEPTEESFEQDVIERSKDVPVIVDLWAPWCGPCRQLAPILDKLVEEYAGRFILAKINTDEHQAIAQAFRVQSIPMVVAIRDGQFVDSFQGALPEEAIRQWLEKIVPDPSDVEVERLRSLEESDQDAAEAGYRAILVDSPDHAGAKIGVARIALANGSVDEAERMITELEARGFLEPEAERIQSEIHLRRGAAGAHDIGDAKAAAEAQPDDVSAQVAYMDALAVAGQKDQALEHGLSLIQRDRARFSEAVRLPFLDIINTLSDDDAASQYRRRLATLLY